MTQINKEEWLCGIRITLRRSTHVIEKAEKKAEKKARRAAAEGNAPAGKALIVAVTRPEVTIAAVIMIGVASEGIVEATARLMGEPIEVASPKAATQNGALRSALCAALLLSPVGRFYLNLLGTLKIASRLFPMLMVPISVPTKVLFIPFVAVSCHPLPGVSRLPFGNFVPLVLVAIFYPPVRQ